MSVTIRPERGDDAAAIGAMVERAFALSRHGAAGEAAIIDTLRREGDLAVSLVALDAELAVVGHIAFSPVRIADGAAGWYGLAPIAVAPGRQGEGIGGSLIDRGLVELRRHDARGVVVLGDPVYYHRFGFRGGTRLTYRDAPPEYVQALIFEGEQPAGEIHYARAFDAA